MREEVSKRPILIGYMVLDGYAEDFSDWDGHITGPTNPKGANLYWHDPIEMIEKRAYDELVAENQKLNELVDLAKELRMYCLGVDASTRCLIEVFDGKTYRLRGGK
jgi:hypothetical protein